MKNIHVLPKSNSIYITSDEEIKEGDWFITDDKIIEKCAFDWKAREWHKKIILTTDADLIKDGVQEIEDYFLEWFVKNPNCEEVKTELFPKFSNKLYGIIIPKEEPKQETLEEAKKRILDSNYMTKNDADIFEMGVKWQQERMYSEEELLHFADFYHKYKELIKAEKWEIIEMSKEEVFKKWFEQFKNK